MSVRLIRSEKNQGPAAGRNTLLNAAVSSYIHFHDADDIFRPEWARKVSAALKSRPDIVFTEVSYRTLEGGTAENVMGLHRLLSGRDLLLFGLRQVVLPSSATFLRSKALEIGGFKIRDILPMAEDFDFYLRFAAAADRFEVITDSLILAWKRTESHSSVNYRQCFISVIDSLSALYGTLPKKYLPELAETAWRTGCQLYHLGMKNEAMRAFTLAKRSGTPEYRGRPGSYAWVANTFGAMTAESISAFYRRSISEEVRASLRKDRKPAAGGSE